MFQQFVQVSFCMSGLIVLLHSYWFSMTLKVTFVHVQNTFSQMDLALWRCSFVRIMYTYITMLLDLYRSTEIYAYTYIHTSHTKGLLPEQQQEAQSTLLWFVLIIGSSRYSFQVWIVLGPVRSRALFVTLHVSHITLFPYRLLQAHFTSRRDNWQVIFHVILNKMTHTVKYMVFGSHLMKEAKEYTDG